MLLSGERYVPQNLQADPKGLRRGPREPEESGGDRVRAVGPDKGVLDGGLPGAEVPEEAEAGQKEAA